MAAVLRDTTIVIWDTTPWEVAISRILDAARPAELAKLVAELKDNPYRAYAAVRLLSTAGDRSVDLLKKSIEPAKSADKGLLSKLIADLDAPKFAVREKALKELFALGYKAESALRAALEAKPNAEVKARLEKLLAKLDLQEYDADTLQSLRAVRVLRDIGSPAARELLAAWAKGDAYAPLTKAAQDK